MCFCLLVRVKRLLFDVELLMTYDRLIGIYGLGLIRFATHSCKLILTTDCTTYLEFQNYT